jgi:ceroid-lipofuscinosis MFS transporter 7
MMGWLTAAGSLARTLGPLLVSTVYHQFGPRWTFLTSSIFVVLGFFILFGLYSRIVPLQNVY